MVTTVGVRERIAQGMQSARRVLKGCVIVVLALSIMPFTVPPSEAYASSIDAFPASYRPALRDLQRRFPNWTFVPLHTNMDWNHVLNQQTVAGRSLVPATWEAAMRDPNRPQQVEPGWVNASRAGVAFYMDPRNFLDERNILQFELLSFNSRYHTHAGVQSMLNGTFMAGTGNIRYRTTAGTMSTLNQSYSTAIFNAGRDNLTSPYYLTARILQEVGTQGSNSVSGNVPGFIGIYNFYNIGAHAGANPVHNGLNWARSGTSHGRPWTDPVRSIRGGAEWISERYIRRGQDSLYLQKWSVSPNTPPSHHFWHQFMTNISAAASEGQRMHTAYSNLGLLDSPKAFYIPVFNNMPQHPSYRPGSGFPDSDTSLHFVNAASVNVRTGPGTGFSSMGSFRQGTPFRVLNFNHSTANGHTWAQVRFADGRTGFIANSFLTARVPLVNEITPPPAEPGVPGTFNVDDIAAVNAIIAANNGLTWLTADADGNSVPAQWNRVSGGNGVVWSSAETDRRIVALHLNSLGLTELPGLPEGLEKLAVRDNQIRLIDVSNLPDFVDLSFGNNPIDRIVFDADLEIDFEVVGSGRIGLGEYKAPGALLPGGSGATSDSRLFTVEAAAAQGNTFEKWEYDFAGLEITVDMDGSGMSFDLPEPTEPTTLELTAHFVAAPGGGNEGPGNNNNGNNNGNAAIPVTEIYSNNGNRLTFRQPANAANPFPADVTVRIRQVDADVVANMARTDAGRQALASWVVTIHSNGVRITDFSVFDNLEFELTLRHGLSFVGWDVNSFAVHHHNSGTYRGNFVHQLDADFLRISGIDRFSEYTLVANRFTSTNTESAPVIEEPAEIIESVEETASVEETVTPSNPEPESRAATETPGGNEPPVRTAPTIIVEPDDGTFLGRLGDNWPLILFSVLLATGIGVAGYVIYKKKKDAESFEFKPTAP